ncbi:hypothetical protein [Planomicrobium okeanokoites]|uniref:Uncharacterized protein n=1 Tax=Planomicrobium okeanokoites TaxID=244 RepID=A0ABV7KL70_PLAOK|nr:hypothetical protein [Planomicrobium okeanokoites]
MPEIRSDKLLFEAASSFYMPCHPLIRGKSLFIRGWSLFIRASLQNCSFFEFANSSSTAPQSSQPPFPHSQNKSHTQLLIQWAWL